MVYSLQKILWKIFPPGSGGELFLRTLYHHLTAGKLYNAWLARRARASYPRWLKAQEEWLQSAGRPAEGAPGLTFLLPVAAGKGELAAATVRTILAQRSRNWNLLLAGGQGEPGLQSLLGGIAGDERVHIQPGEGGSLPDLVSGCRTEYFACCLPGDEFSRFFVESFRQAALAEPASVVIFTDSDLRTGLRGRPVPHFKPEAYSPGLHLSTNYLSRAAILKSAAAGLAPGLDAGLEFGVQEWALLLGLCSRPARITHIPRVLVHQYAPGPFAAAGVEKMLSAHLAGLGLRSPEVKMAAAGPTCRWSTARPPVSIIIPTRNKLALLKTLLDSIFQLTDYPRYEVVLVDNASTDPAVGAYYRELLETRNLRVIPFEGPFNYSRAVNLGAAHAAGELYLFLNNDMRVLAPDWLDRLVQWALLPGVGVAGAKLLHPGGTIQHAGLVMGMKDFVGHLYLNAPDHYHGLLGSADWYREVSAVTGACQMVRREVFAEIGGYDEAFELVFSDIHFCLQALKKGYRVVYTPDTVLVHFEGASRGYTTPVRDILRGFEVLQDWMERDDPYFSPNLTCTQIPACRFDPHHLERRLEQVRQRKEAYTR